MNPFRFDVLGVTALLSAPVIGLALSGGITVDGVVTRFLACWAAATLGVSLLNSQIAAAQAEAARKARLLAEMDALTAEDDDDQDEPEEDQVNPFLQNSAGEDSPGVGATTGVDAAAS